MEDYFLVYLSLSFYNNFFVIITRDAILKYMTKCVKKNQVKFNRNEN